MAVYSFELNTADSRRCRLRHLILEGSKLVLRNRFDTECGIPPTVFLKEPAVKDKTEFLKAREIISEPQYKNLYPSSGDSSSKNYDVTLLVALHRNLFTTRRSNDVFWSRKPGPHDTSTDADVVRIRMFRNTLVHDSLTPTEEEFESMWSEIAEVLVRLGSGIPTLNHDIENMKTKCLDKDYEKKMDKILKEWIEQDKAFGDTIIETVRAHSLFENALGGQCA